MKWSFDYLKCDELLATVFIDGSKVSLVNYTNDIIDRPFGTCENPSIEDVDNLFKERCFPESRFNAKQLLKGKLYGYDPSSIVLDTHGIMVDDCYWLRFDGENLCWDDVKNWHYHKSGEPFI